MDSFHCCRLLTIIETIIIDLQNIHKTYKYMKTLPEYLIPRGITGKTRLVLDRTILYMLHLIEQCGYKCDDCATLYNMKISELQDLI